MTANYTGVAQSEPTFDKVTMNGPIVRQCVTGLTALAGGGQAGATLLSADVAKVTTVATIGDSVLLPTAVPGHERLIVNATTNSMNIYPAVGDAVNAGSANAAYALAGGKIATLICTDAGHWYANLSA